MRKLCLFLLYVYVPVAAIGGLLSLASLNPGSQDFGVIWVLISGVLGLPWTLMYVVLVRSGMGGGDGFFAFWCLLSVLVNVVLLCRGAGLYTIRSPKAPTTDLSGKQPYHSDSDQAGGNP